MLALMDANFNSDDACVSEATVSAMEEHYDQVVARNVLELCARKGVSLAGAVSTPLRIVGFLPCIRY
ncbi:hypothetical protein TELCIR_00244 [Teladorsagia circumcincta]|uniref:Uncharacterized protein n=1 Tax=Teladorsagia circumcincta TaxID=45464 RepID=A0A2G9V587_TELCI|nr:hypothetical protein TELCIR_00244 [Teladorsagia circumcincta]